MDKQSQLVRLEYFLPPVSTKMHHSSLYLYIMIYSVMDTCNSLTKINNNKVPHSVSAVLSLVRSLTCRVWANSRPLQRSSGSRPHRLWVFLCLTDRNDKTCQAARSQSLCSQILQYNTRSHLIHSVWLLFANRRVDFACLPVPVC